MNRLLLVVGFTAALSACNSGDNTEAGNSADTASHSAHAGTSGDTAASAQPNNTATISGQSMMGIMQRNMDQMKSMESTGSPDKDFAAMMKTHHMGAMEMAQLEVAQGTDAQLKQMAQKMLEAQQKEMTQLDAFLSSTNNKDTVTAQRGSSAFHQQVMSHMNNMKMDMNHSGSVDDQFAQMMIPHHQGGIDMAKAYLKSGAQDQKLKTIANKIASDQQKEINELQAWINKNK
ncbi:MAG TPA: DUF305 domain-containing protein [Flavisolibacter sp.]|nr:DUF305 domain-containing protein [Flavisolibacter sp.]